MKNRPLAVNKVLLGGEKARCASTSASPPLRTSIHLFENAGKEKVSSLSLSLSFLSLSLSLPPTGIRNWTGRRKVYKKRSLLLFFLFGHRSPQVGSRRRDKKKRKKKNKNDENELCFKTFGVA